MPNDGRFVHWSQRHPRVGEDVGADAEVLGIDEASGLPIIRRRQPQPGPCGCGTGRGRGRRRGDDDDDQVGDDDVEGDDELGADDQAELAGYDDEIEADDDDDDEVLGADGQEDVGASYKHLEHREQKLTRLLHKLELDLKTTPSRRRRKIKHLKKRIAKVQRKLEKIHAKKAGKVKKGAAATGRSMSETQRALEAGEWNVWVRRDATLKPDAARGFVRTGSADTATGARTTIRLLDDATNDTFAAVQFAAGADHRTSTIGLVSDQISYERLRVVGIEFKGTIAPTAVAGAVPIDTAPEFMLVSLMRDGYADQVTTETPIMLEMQQSNSGLFLFKGTWDGLRQAIFLDKRDTVTVSVKVGQLRTNAAAIDWTVQCALIVDILSDDQLR